MNKKTLLASALVLSMNSLFTAVSYAESTKNKSENTEEMECVTQEALEAMSEEARDALTSPACEDDEDKAEDEEKTQVD